MNIYIYLLTLTIFVLFAGCEKEAMPSNKISFHNITITKTSHNLGVDPLKLFFVNENTGYVVASDNQIYKTSNAGNSWSSIYNEAAQTSGLTSLFFIDELNGFVSGYSSSGRDEICFLLKTIDGGITWSKTILNDFGHCDWVKFFDKQNGIAIALLNNSPEEWAHDIIRTGDGGKTWELEGLGVYEYLKNSHFIASNDSLMLIPGRYDSKQLHKSIDNGKTWQSVNLPVFYNEGNIISINKLTWLMESPLGICKTTDGGLTWRIANFPFSNLDYNVHFFDENQGFKLTPNYNFNKFTSELIFINTVLFYTDDSGESWKEAITDKFFSLDITHYPYENLGFGINSEEFYVINRK